jgi:DNA-binding CsgD family transcriptional regulator
MASVVTCAAIVTIARERFDELEPQFQEERRRRGLPLTRDDVVSEFSGMVGASAINAAAPRLGSELIEINGAVQRGYPADAADRFRRLTLTEEHRNRYTEVDHYASQQAPRLARQGLSREAAEVAAGDRARSRRKAIRSPSLAQLTAPRSVDARSRQRRLGELRAEGRKNREIAAELDMSEEWVKQMVRKLGLPPRAAGRPKKV